MRSVSASIMPATICGGATTRQPGGSAHACGQRLNCCWSFSSSQKRPCGLSKGLLNSILHSCL
ncbi:hypothetical protein BN135_3549 [Cronobacter muytjensii 530]